MLSMWTMIKHGCSVNSQVSARITKLKAFGANKLFFFLPMEKILDLSKLEAQTDNKINDSKFCLRKGGKYFGYRRKYWLPAFSPSAKMF